MTIQRMMRHTVALLWVALLLGCANYPWVPDSGGEPTADEEAARDVVTRLQADHVTGPVLFTVSVEDGVATLRGVVPDPNVRLRALGIARGTAGVHEVVDKLQAW